MKKNITIKDIARIAGVSPAVVSVALSDKSSSTRMSEKTREQIRAIARQQNYRPNIAARGFQKGKSYLIGVFLNCSSSYILMRLLEELHDCCYEQNYDIILYPTSTLELEKRSLESSRSRNLDGIITIPVATEEGNNAGSYHQFLEDGIPVVQLFYSISEKLDFVGRDYVETGREAVRILYQHGHRKIGLVIYDIYRDPELGRNSNDFYKAAKEEAEKLKMELLTYSVEVPAELDNFPGQEEGEKILALPSSERPTALFSNSNTLLYKVYGVLLQGGLKIPEDISLLGCGQDLNQKRTLLPDLSLLIPPMREIVRAAASRIIFPDALESKGISLFKSVFSNDCTIKNISDRRSKK
ncbi:MAG: LacI family DNA-binding transcriptional regulator [Lentisphaeria bacterium]|nr:LacI family DNA-binding transcriptional regulator [Lentisphaeria bacterium]